MSIIDHLSRIAGEAFSELGLPASHGAVVPSQRRDLAQFQCNGAMSAAKLAEKNPRDIATEVAAVLAGHPDIASASVAGPGFINLDLTDAALIRIGNEASLDDHLGANTAEHPLTVVVDYAGPNVAKAMHVGHLRATIIGDALARTFAFAGHRVIRDPHFGDWGFQMGLLIAAVLDEEISPETITLDDLQRIYPEAAERARRDEAFGDRAREATVRLQQGNETYRTIWRQMKEVSEVSQRANFAALGVTFDLWYGESDVHERIEPMVSSMESEGIAEESDGAIVVRVAEDGDNRELPPLILKSTAGGYLYSTTDLATIDMRHRVLDVDLCLYVVDRRQSDHFLQVFRAARRAGIAPPAMGLEHIGFGTMNGPDGKPFKTREGGVVRLADVIDLVNEAARARLDEAHLAEEYPEQERQKIAGQVGVAALKFGDLINNRTSDYIFDLDRFCSFEGKTGPYLQYAAVRIQSILRRAAEAGLAEDEMTGLAVDSERQLVLDLLQFPEVLDRTLELRAPNHIAEYAHAVAGQFNRFYDDCHILSEEDPTQQASWLRLCAWTFDTLAVLLNLLGIEIPDRM